MTKKGALVPAPEWPKERLEVDRRAAVDRFREARISEPLERYLEVFDRYDGHVEDFLEATVDLTQLEHEAATLLSKTELLEIFRYLAGPPISEDDLKVVAEVRSLSGRALKQATHVERLVSTVRAALDRRRFPWVSESREPSEAERKAAVVGTAALIAAQRAATTRRNEGKHEQEQLVRGALLAVGFREVHRRKINVLPDAPGLGELCMESELGERKADLIVRLWDNRVMPIECKVSNSATNSIKRLKNDAAAKAGVWKSDFGATQVVPTAVLSGVYGLRHLEDAQRRGLTLFWAHDLAAMVEWIATTKSA